ncbi:hypothetical protein ElyMa_006962900 [Elysia marginata]|uniref:Uncharacterized protein n=1 Tax=Elysia marginata TaxID=1093978 RepID=A0AAV4JLW0_9GAST|nr:hypothetical protein ElyMa_006962900 [Elysia marginata]
MLLLFWCCRCLFYKRTLENKKRRVLVQPLTSQHKNSTAPKRALELILVVVVEVVVVVVVVVVVIVADIRF